MAAFFGFTPAMTLFNRSNAVFNLAVCARLHDSCGYLPFRQPTP
jgi:hypothetical protein